MKCSCLSHNGFLTERGLKEAQLAQWTDALYGVDGMDMVGYLDSVGSVSALVEVEDLYAHVTDPVLEAQSERFHNGS